MTLVYEKQPYTPILPSNLELLDTKTIKGIQQIAGTLLSYEHAVDPTMLVVLDTLVEEQTKGTQNTARAISQLLNYSASHIKATIQYNTSNLSLYIHSHTSFLSLPKIACRAGGILSKHCIKTASSYPCQTSTYQWHHSCHQIQNT